MKHKKLGRKFMAYALSAVMALGNVSTVFANEADVQNPEETTIQTVETLTETPPAVPEPIPQEPVAETPPEAPKQEPQEPAAPEQTPQEPAAPEQTPQEPAAPEQTPQEPAAPEQEPQEPAAPEQEPQEPAAPEQEPQEPAEEIPEEEPVKNEAMELIHTVYDESGRVEATIKAEIQAESFDAGTDAVTMEVKAETENTYIQKQIKENLPKYKYLGDYVAYDITFKVNGEIAESAKEIKLTYYDMDVDVQDTANANVFCFQNGRPEEITQRQELVDYLRKAGQSTADVDNNDLSEITLDTAGKAKEIQMEVRKSGIFGCYVEKLSEEKTYTAEVDGVEIQVTAPEGAFDRAADEVYMTAEALTAEQNEKVEKILTDKAEENEETLVDYRVYDINLWADEEHTKKIQPQIPVEVNFKNMDLKQQDEQEIKPIRIDEEKGTVTDIEGNATEKEATMTAEHFTFYGTIVNAPQQPDGINYEESYNINPPKAISIAPEGNNANEWQIVSGRYGENLKGLNDTMQTTDDGLFRFQKNVIPAGIENEFYIYLNIEPQMGWHVEDIISRASVWILNSNCNKDSIILPDNPTPEEVKKASSGGQAAKLSESKEAADANTTSPGQYHHVSKIILKSNDPTKPDIVVTEDANGNPLDNWYSLSQNSTDSFTILIAVPGSNTYWKISEVSIVNETLTLPADAWKIFEDSIVDKGNYGATTPNGTVTEVTDPMGCDVAGDFIEFLEMVDSTAGTNPVWNENTKTITWTNFPDPEVSSNPNDFYILDEGLTTERVYRKNAYQLVYKVRLKVEENGFDSCAEYLKDHSSTDFPYETNGTTTLKYSYPEVDANGKETGNTLTGSDDFIVPEVRGLLYDIEFKKVDDNGKALAGAEFTLTGKTGANQDVDTIPNGAESNPKRVYKVTSDADGIVRFENLPWGTYTITETKVPDNYIGADVFSRTLCYTTNPDDFIQDPKLLKNELYKKELLPNNGNVINKEKTTHTVIKEWVGDPGAESINVTLKAYITLDGSEREMTDDEYAKWLPEIVRTQTLQGSQIETKNWRYTWENLPKYYHYTETDEATGREADVAVLIRYTVEEDMTGLSDRYQSSKEESEDGLTTTIINTPKAIWQILKKSSSIDSDGNKPLLQGAEFTLTRAAAETVPEKIYYGKSSATGVIEWYSDPERTAAVDSKDIEAGTYTLAETKAPAGYAKSEETWTVIFSTKGGIPEIEGKIPEEGTIIENGSELKTYTYTFENTPVYELPGTGGRGIFWYLISGTLLMMAGALILYRNRMYESKITG